MLSRTELKLVWPTIVFNDDFHGKIRQQPLRASSRLREVRSSISFQVYFLGSLSAVSMLDVKWLRFDCLMRLLVSLRAFLYRFQICSSLVFVHLECLFIFSVCSSLVFVHICVLKRVQQGGNFHHPTIL
jgi:hypothetical protein